MTELDIVIVSHNTRAELLGCLNSIHVSQPAALRTVIVVDNASTDGSADAVKQTWPTADVVALDTNAGFAAANNVGLKRSAAALVLLLNSDTVVRPGAIEALASRLLETGAAVAGPRLIRADGSPEVSFGPMLSPFAELLQRMRGRAARSRNPIARHYVRRLVSRERDVDWVSGACMLVRREAAFAAGLLDERYFMYEEDVDFCAAVRAHGGRILFTPRAEIVHLGGRSVRAGGSAAAAHYDRSHLAFYEKHAPGWTPWLRAWLRLRGKSR